MGMCRVKGRTVSTEESFREMVSLRRIRFQLMPRGKSNNQLLENGWGSRGT